MGRGASKISSGGFSTSLVQETVYHGTNNPNITSFNTSGRESNGAIFFADDPDYAEEEAYIKNENYGGEQTIYDVKLNIQNPTTVTLKAGDFGDPIKERKYIENAKKEGFDSVIFKETGNPVSNSTFYAVFSPKQVKILKKNKL